jgi:hypothetical protein
VMLVWLNGTFGVGKSTTGDLMVRGDARWRLFDPEWVGFMLRANLADRSFGGDFQHLPSWRRLVPIVAAEISSHTGQDLVAVQTVLHQAYWNELVEGAQEQGFDVLHILLDADPGTLRRRIEAAENQLARQWRLDHVETYLTARDWLLATADVVLDTTATPPDEVARRVLAAASLRSPHPLGS